MYSGGLAVTCYLASGGQLASLRSFCLFVLFIFLYALAAAYNNLHDIQEDRLNKRVDNPLLESPVTIRQLQFFAAGILTGIAACALALTQPLTTWIIFLALCITFAYSDPRIRLKSKGVAGIICLGVFYSVLPIILGYLQIQGISSLLLATILSIYCLSLGGLLAKDYKDEDGDRKTGTNTMLVQHGKRAVRITAYCFLLAGFLAQLYIVSLQNNIWSLCFVVLYCFIVTIYHLREGNIPHILLRLSHASLVALAYVNLA